MTVFPGRLIVCLSLLLSILSCVSTVRSQTGPLTRLRVGTTNVSPSNWPLFVGQKQGFFTAEGLNLEVIVLRGSTLQTQALLTDGVQINAYTVDTAARAVLAGAPLKLVASNQERPTFRVLVHKDIKAWSDLKGKHLAAGSPGGTYYSVLLAMLDANGIGKNDVNIIAIGNSSARVHAMNVGTVQGAIVAQPEDLVLIDGGFKVLGSVKEYLKNIQYQGYVVNEKWASTHEETLVGFLRAVRRSFTWLHDPKNKKSSIDILATQVHVKRDWLETIYDLMINQQYLSTDGMPDRKGIENMLTLTTKYGVGRVTIPPMERWVDLSYMKKAAR